MNNYNVLNQQYYTIGTVFIDESFHMQSADEEFFRYFGNDVTYSIQRTIYEDDLPYFRSVLNSLERNEHQKIVLRYQQNIAGFLRQ